MSAGKEQMLKLISELIKGKYERMDLSNLFSSTFFRILNKARSGEAQQSVSFMFF
jgi:hypothetical protein